MTYLLTCICDGEPAHHPSMLAISLSPSLPHFPLFPPMDPLPLVISAAMFASTHLVCNHTPETE